MFNVGDRVVLIHSNGVFTLLERIVEYEIEEIDDYNGNIRMVDDDMFYDPRRFIKDLKFLRRTKLKQMNLWK